MTKPQLVTLFQRAYMQSSNVAIELGVAKVVSVEQVLSIIFLAIPTNGPLY